MFVYLDNSSTTRPYDEVIELMAKVQREDFGNPSSLHTLGITAEKYVKASRNSLAEALGVSAAEIYFTSGGTEADNTVLKGAAESRGHGEKKKIITTAVEHPAVLEPLKYLESKGFEIVKIGVNRSCRLDMQSLAEAIDENTILISVMTVNNETGAIFPIEEIGRLKDDFNRRRGTEIILHTDAVQAFGKMPLSAKGNLRSVDALSLSGHKIHGPKGVGALYLRKGVNLPAFMLGGGQERNMRSGTENTAGIAGLGAAADKAFSCFVEREAAVRAARDRLLAGLRAELADDMIVNSPTGEDGLPIADALPSVLSVSFPGTRGEVLLHTLEQDGIFVSTGSACSSNKKGNSHVLSAMGMREEEIEGTLRFSFSQFNTAEEMDYAAEKTAAAVRRFRKLQRRKT